MSTAPISRSQLQVNLEATLREHEALEAFHRQLSAESNVVPTVDQQVPAEYQRDLENIARIAATIEAKRSECARLCEKLADAERNRQQQQQLHNELEQELRRLQKRLEAGNQRRGELEDELRIEESIREQERSNIKLWQEKSIIIDDSRRNAERQRQETSNLIIRLTKALSLEPNELKRYDLEQEIKRQQEIVSQLDNTIKGLDGKAADARKEGDRLKQRLSKQKQKIDLLRKESTQCEDELKLKVSEEERALYNLNHQGLPLKESLEGTARLNEQIAQEEGAIEALEQELSAARAQLAEDLALRMHANEEQRAALESALVGVNGQGPAQRHADPQAISTLGIRIAERAWLVSTSVGLVVVAVTVVAGPPPSSLWAGLLTLSTFSIATVALLLAYLGRSPGGPWLSLAQALSAAVAISALLSSGLGEPWRVIALAGLAMLMVGGFALVFHWTFEQPY